MTTMNAKFPGKCRDCGLPINVGDTIRWARGVGALHATRQVCADLTAQAQAAKRTAPVVPAAPAPTVPMPPLIAFLESAKLPKPGTKGLKAPKARFLAADGKSELLMMVAGPRSKFPGSLKVFVAGNWVGAIGLNGTVYGPMQYDKATLDILEVVAKDPAAAAAKYGALMGRCSFCNKTITDEGSVEVGYGPDCARHYGLPHTPKGTLALETVA